MTTSERFAKFDEDFARLKNNREKVPLEQLKTRYAKAYNSLVASIEEYAEWFTQEYIDTLAIQTNPKDEAGNAWLKKKVDAILAEERGANGKYQQGLDALIQNLDREGFEHKVWEIHDRLMREAYDPYQQRYNRWIGEPGNRWIYNSLFKAYWKVDPESSDGGYWIDKDWNHKGLGYPPKIGGEDNRDER